MDASISPQELKSQFAGAKPPLVIDVRRAPAYRGATSMIAGALRRDPGLSRIGRAPCRARVRWWFIACMVKR